MLSGRRRQSFRKRRAFRPEDQDCTYEIIIAEERAAAGSEAAKHLAAHIELPGRMVKLENVREGVWRRRFELFTRLRPAARDYCQRHGLSLARYRKLLDHFEDATGERHGWLSDFQLFAIQVWEWDHHEFREPIRVRVDITPRFEAVPAVHYPIYQKKPEPKRLERRPDLLDGGWIEDPEGGWSRLLGACGFASRFCGRTHTKIWTT